MYTSPLLHFVHARAQNTGVSAQNRRHGQLPSNWNRTLPADGENTTIVHMHAGEHKRLSAGVPQVFRRCSAGSPQVSQNDTAGFRGLPWALNTASADFRGLHNQLPQASASFRGHQNQLPQTSAGIKTSFRRLPRASKPTSASTS